jgi:hypothetical protein
VRIGDLTRTDGADRLEVGVDQVGLARVELSKVRWFGVHGNVAKFERSGDRTREILPTEGWPVVTSLGDISASGPKNGQGGVDKQHDIRLAACAGCRRALGIHLVGSRRRIVQLRCTDRRIAWWPVEMRLPLFIAMAAR